MSRSLAEPRNYQEILDRGYAREKDFCIAFNDRNIARCLLAAPHGGGIEPGTSELLRALADLGDWAWYEFAGYLRKGNKDGLHITSTDYDEPTLLTLLPRTNFLLTLHGTTNTRDRVVYVGGAWDEGRATIMAAINGTTAAHGITARDAPAPLRGREPTNLTNRGTRGQGIQLEFSRGARNQLFPPDCSREARGRRTKALKALAQALHNSLQTLTRQ